MASFASAVVLAGAQVAPDRSSKLALPRSNDQSAIPGVVKDQSHKPDIKESKSLIDQRTQRSRGYVENKGQWPSDVKFLARSNGLDLWVTDSGLRINAYQPKGEMLNGHVIGVRFLGSKGLKPAGHDEVGSKTDFLQGEKEAKGARTFKTVKAASVYPNILLKNYFDGSRPRYDFVVAPHGDPSLIKMNYQASEGLNVTPTKLTIKTSIGDLVESKLLAYQIVAGKKKSVPVAFRKIDKNTVGFKVGAYDRSKQLVIDPLIYGSYYGGDSSMDEVHAVVSDIQGGVYMTGQTMSPDFPVIFGPYSFVLRGQLDAFIAKLQGDVYRHDYAVFLGGYKEEVGEFLQLDQFGNLWVSGYTSSPNFPGSSGVNVQYITYDTEASLGPNAAGVIGTAFSLPNGQARFRVRFPGFSYSNFIPWNVSAANLQIALQNYIDTFFVGETVQVTAIGGNITVGRGFKITFSPGITGILEVDNNFLGAVYSATRNVNGRAQLLRHGLTSPNTGAYSLSVQYTRGGNFTGTTDPIPFGSGAAVVQAAINSLNADPVDPNQTDVNLGVIVTPATQGGTGTLPATDYIILFPASQPNVVVNQGTMNVNYVVLSTGMDEIFWNPNSAAPTGGYTVGVPPDPNPDGFTFNMSIGGIFTTPTIRYNTSAQQLHDAMASVGPQLPGNAVVVIPLIPGLTMPNTRMAAVYVAGLAGSTAAPLAIYNDQVIAGTLFDFSPPVMLAEGRTNPRPHYKVHNEFHCFVMRFKQDTNTFLSPLPTKAFFFGGSSAPQLTGFRIIPHDNPVAGEAIRMAFGGWCANNFEYLPEVPGTPRGGGIAGFVLRVNYSDTTGNFTVVNGPTKYIDAYDSTIDVSYPIIVGGIDVDANANVYVGGTIRGAFGNTTDTSLPTANDDFVFITTPVDSLGTLRDGRLLRFWDGFVRKYSATGALTYSVLIGGDGADEGMGVAVDANGDSYLLGRSRSFNYPRTRGVFGEAFTANLVSTVAKLNPSATDLIYCTHLRTGGNVTPVGISVDARGIAFMTFMISRGTIFREWTPNNDPNLCDGFNNVGSIPVTGDAMKGAYTQAGGGDYGGTDGALMALNPSGTGILYGSYLGTTLDDQVFRPFVDKSGDVWICGWTDTYRHYIRWRRWNRGVVVFTQRVNLPGGMITPLAFRPGPDPNPGFGGSGTTDVGFQLYNNIANVYPVFWDTVRDRDGFVDRLRIGLASVASVTFNPGTIAGGLGGQTTGTVTLSQPAPAGGAVVTLSMLPSAPGSFDPVGALSTTSITIPAGQNARQFTVFSRSVTDNTPVDVTASYQGNFKVGRVVVVPWLQSFSITPEEVVGGNPVVGRVQLAAVAGTLGVTVQISSDTTDVVPVQNVTVPNGQTALAFTINTAGVEEDTTVTLNASLLGVGKPFQLIVHPAQLKSLTFNPNPVTSGTGSVGTVVINGQPGPTGFDVNLSLAGSPAGYTLNPTTLTFAPGQTSKTFTMTTPFEAATINRTVTAAMVPKAGYTPNSVQGTLSVTAAQITNFTITPSTVNGGQTAVGQVTLSTAALAGGARVAFTVSPSNGVVTVPQTVLVPQGQTAVTFNIPTTTVIADGTFTITAIRGPSTVARTLTVKALTFTLGIPAAIASGSTGAGTVTLSGPAPAGGLTVFLTSNKPSILPVPATLSFAAGQTAATFPLSPAAVAVDTDVIISATIGGTTKTATTTVHASKLFELTLTPNYVLNLQTVRCTLTLDGPAPAGGLLVTLTNSNAAIASVPASVLVPAGKSSVTFSFATRRVTRPLVTTITGFSSNSGQASANLTVHP